MFLFSCSGNFANRKATNSLITAALNHNRSATSVYNLIRIFVLDMLKEESFELPGT